MRTMQRHVFVPANPETWPEKNKDSGERRAASAACLDGFSGVPSAAFETGGKLPMKSFAKLVAAILLLAAIPAHAQVFKCVVDGKTVYQQAPCAGESKAVNLTNAAPPSAADIAAAKKRNELAAADIAAAEERNRLDKLRTPRRQSLPEVRDALCAKTASLARTEEEKRRTSQLCGKAGIR